MWAVHMTYFEKDAIVSGAGISRIGRRTGIPGLDLTMEAVRAAIADAGLSATDIDGIATLGDTPASEVNAELKIDAADCGSGFGTGGLLSPVMSACRAVAERRARHVIVSAGARACSLLMSMPIARMIWSLSMMDICCVVGIPP